ncbi:MAG: hypothetical protein ACOCWA_00470 [Bacteroidota bacterium]
MEFTESNTCKGRLWLILAVLPFFFSCRTVKTFQQSNISLSKEERIAALNDQLHETSGLEFYRDSLMSFNDSGGEAMLYIFSPEDPSKLNTIRLEKAENADWEDVTRGSGYYFIGDFGNNSGNRDTMVIYRLSEKEMNISPVVPELISFSFKEKLPEFKNKTRNPFDCEAMAFINDSLWLFTKNWRDKSSWVYKLPITPGHYDLEVNNILHPGMLVTAADYISEEKLLILIGYQFFSPRIRIYRYTDRRFEEILLLRTGNLFGVQTEGIVVKDNMLYFSNEKSLRRQGLYRIFFEY